MSPRVVAIDGPSGVGKSTVARRVAQAEELPYLDTGAMYRAVALAAAAAGVDPEDRAAVAELVAGLDLELNPGPDGVAAVFLAGEPVEERIRNERIGDLASRLASHPPVRRLLVEIQRAFGHRHGAVLEGRDIGTVVFPETPHKFFLDASEEVRVERRVDQLRRRGEAANGEQVAADLRCRDRRDRERANSPLLLDASYQRLDTSDLELGEVVAEVLRRLRDAG